MNRPTSNTSVILILRFYRDAALAPTAFPPVLGCY